MSTLLEYLPFILIGLGVGYIITLGSTGGPTDLDYRKHDVEVQKARLRMLATAKTNKLGK
jgi:hypothetical protein